MKLGEFIKQYREEHGISQREFARRCGISNTAIQSIENGFIERSEFDRRKNEIDSVLTELEPTPELPEIHTDFNEMYHNLTTPKKAVFWRAFLSSITVDRDKNVNIEFHTAKVLAERLSTLKEIE